MRVGLDPDVAAADSGATACTVDESCITLLDGGVRTEALAVLFSSGSTPALGPDQPPEVSASLVAPQVLHNAEVSAGLHPPVSPLTRPRLQPPGSHLILSAAVTIIS